MTMCMLVTGSLHRLAYLHLGMHVRPFCCIQPFSIRTWLHLVGDPGAGASKVADGAASEAAAVPRPLLPLHELCSLPRLLHPPAPIGHATKSGALLHVLACAVQLA